VLTYGDQKHLLPSTILYVPSLVPLDVVREEATRRGEGGSHLGVVREVAIRHGEKCCFTQGGEED
jgi:hypothetical protein